MKKHDEGYILAYVTVVLLIFCLVATMILTGALKNLNHQQNAIAQMEDEYFAEGMIEQVLAVLDNKGDSEIAGDLYAQKDQEGNVLATLTVFAQQINSEDDAEDGIYLTLTAQKGTATVTYFLKLDATSAGPDEKENTVTIEALMGYSFVPELPEVEVTP